MRFAHGGATVTRLLALRTSPPVVLRTVEITCPTSRLLSATSYRTRKKLEPNHEVPVDTGIAVSSTSDSANPIYDALPVVKSRRGRKPRSNIPLVALHSEHGLNTETNTPPEVPSAATTTTHEVIPEPVLSTPKPKSRRNKSQSPSHTLANIIPSSAHHDSLETFLAYATSTSLSPTTKVYLGTHYEYLVSASLTRLGFTTTRVGRGGDHGIDLLGHWKLPSSTAQIPTIVQCKASVPKAVQVRELEGSLASAPSGWRGDNAIGLLVASKVATKGVREALRMTSVPMGFLCVDAEADHGAQGGLVRQFIWNQSAVARCGLAGVSVGLRFPDEDVVVTWMGEPWSPDEKEEKRKQSQNGGKRARKSAAPVDSLFTSEDD